MTGLRRGSLYAVLLGVASFGAARSAGAQATGILKPGKAIAKAAPTPTPAKKVLVKPTVTTGGTAKVIYPPGAAKARETASIRASINAGAVSTHTSPGTVRLNPLNRAPGIEGVNGQAGAFTVTPGSHLTISGWEMGDTLGQVNLIGTFPGGAAPLTVVNWTAGTITANLPNGPNVRGVLDQAVTLQVVTGARRTYVHAGNFLAAREEITVTTNIPRFVRLQAGGTWGDYVGMAPSGAVWREELGRSITCKATGADTLTVLDPGRGFVVTSLAASWGRTDAGDGDQGGRDGSRTYTPGYDFGEWRGASIPVRWGVWRSHSSPTASGMPPDDVCLSWYQISVTVSGPAGVSPF